MVRELNSAHAISRYLGPACYSIAAVIAGILTAAILLDSVPLWSLLSALGEEFAYIGLTLVLMYLASPELGITVLVAILFTGSLNVFLKYLLDIPRPPPELWRAPASGPGLPSGHAQVSTTFWSSVSITVRRRCVVALSAVTVLSISSSRIGLRVHGVYDVLAGVAVGLAVGYVSTLLHKRLGVERVALLLALASAALSYRNMVLNYESSVSASLLGLGVGITLSTPLLKKSVRTLKVLTQLEKYLLLLLVIAFSVAVTVFTRNTSLGLRVAAHTVVGFLVVASPIIKSAVRQSYRTVS